MSRFAHKGFGSLMALMENIHHPVEVAAASDALSRRAAVRFTAIVNGNNLVLGNITYTFVAALGSPAANNVQILNQGTLRENVQQLALAIRNEGSSTNIRYGAGTDANTIATAYWTSQRFSTGTTTIPAGECLFILEIAENTNTAITLSTTATGTITAFTRTFAFRYVLDGNGANPVRGSMHTVLPLHSVRTGGQQVPAGIEVPYHICSIFVVGVDNINIEIGCDIYYSLDEVNFIRVSRSNAVSKDVASKGANQVVITTDTIPAGAGVYVKCGSDGSNASNYVDLKLQYLLHRPGT